MSSTHRWLKKKWINKNIKNFLVHIMYAFHAIKSPKHMVDLSPDSHQTTRHRPPPGTHCTPRGRTLLGNSFHCVHATTTTLSIAPN